MRNGVKVERIATQTGHVVRYAEGFMEGSIYVNGYLVKKGIERVEFDPEVLTYIKELYIENKRYLTETEETHVTYIFNRAVDVNVFADNLVWIQPQRKPRRINHRDR